MTLSLTADPVKANLRETQGAIGNLDFSTARQSLSQIDELAALISIATDLRTLLARHAALA